MLVKAVKIIGRIFFRPGRSVSFFSVSVPTITGSRSFVICATILVGRGGGRDDYSPIQMRRERPKFTYNRTRETRFHAIN